MHWAWVCFSQRGLKQTFSSGSLICLRATFRSSSVFLLSKSMFPLEQVHMIERERENRSWNITKEQRIKTQAVVPEVSGSYTYSIQWNRIKALLHCGLLETQRQKYSSLGALCLQWQSRRVSAGLTGKNSLKVTMIWVRLPLILSYPTFPTSLVNFDYKFGL